MNSKKQAHAHLEGGEHLQAHQYGNQHVHDYQEDFHHLDLNLKMFNIFTTLGTGTFGRVRQVKFKDDPRGLVYALKMLKKTEIIRLNQVEHIKSEKNILKLIKHPFIVNLKGTFQDSKYIYMLFEYLAGGELFSRLRREGRFSVDVTLLYSSEILLALQFLHLNKIVYRDLKPENLLIDNTGHIKLADFGFAKVLEEERTFTLCGTPEYLAPEIVKGSSSKAGYGKSVDWWALGILLFEMLAGYPPFYDCDPNGIYKKIQVGIIEFPRFFSLRTKDLIRKLLNPEIKYRLGCQDDGEEIKKHKWFRYVDFDDVLHRKIPAPWVPPLKNEQDSTWFDEYADSREAAVALRRDENAQFEDF